MVGKTIGRFLLRLAGPSLLAIFMSVTGAVGAEAASVHVTGTVTQPGGGGVQNVSVTATDPGGTTVLYGPSFSAADGSYVLDVDPGTYDFHFVPPGGSGLNPALVSNFTVFTDQVLSVQFVPITHTLSGTIRDTNNNPVPGVAVFIHRESPAPVQSYVLQSSANGSYSFTLPMGVYRLDRINLPGSGVNAVGSLTPSVVPSYDLNASDASQDIVLPPQVDVIVQTRDANNNPVSGVGVSAAAGGSFNTLAIFPGSSVLSGLNYNRQFPSNQNLNGQVVVPILEGVTFAANSICAFFPGGLVCNDSALTLGAGGATVTLIAPPTHTLSGMIRDANNNPVEATVFMHRDSPAQDFSVRSGTNGFYSFTLPLGVYRLTSIRSFLVGSGVNYNNALTPATALTYDLTTSDASQDVQLPPLANLTVLTRDVNNVPVAGGVNVQAGSSPDAYAVFPGSSVLSGLSYGRLLSTGSSGQVVFPIPVGATIGSICAGFPGGVVCHDSVLILGAGGATVTLVAPPTHTLSGVVRDVNNNPVEGVAVLIRGESSGSEFSARSGTNGSYSFTLPVGAYRLNQISLPGSGVNSVSSLTPSTALIYDLTTADATQDISLPPFTNLTILTRSANNIPLSGVGLRVEASASQNTFAIFAGSSVLSNYRYARLQSTGSNGQAVFPMLEGTMFAANGICASFSGGAVCNASALTVGAGGVTIVFQDQASNPAPSAPTGLSALTPTSNAPALTWNPVTGAVNYRVFRNGTQIATTVNPNFVDSAVSVSDSYSYTVQAVNLNNVASQSSLPFVVVYDITAPVMGVPMWSVNPKPVGASTTTLTVPAADGLSGVVGGEYFIGVDPGVGGGTVMTFGAGALSATLGSGLAEGVYDVGVRARDAAGNWSTVTTTMLIVYDPAIQGVTGKAPGQGFVPAFGSDLLPGLVSAGQTDKADYGFTVDWTAGGAIDPASDFHFLYQTGSQCNSPHPQNCHDFRLDATGFSLLVIDQTGSSRARFQGMATTVVDGVTTSNPFTVEGIDGDRLTPAGNDMFTLKVYAVGADPTTATSIYQVTVSLANGNSVKVR